MIQVVTDVCFNPLFFFENGWEACRYPLVYAIVKMKTGVVNRGPRFLFFVVWTAEAATDFDQTWRNLACVL